MANFNYRIELGTNGAELTIGSLTQDQHVYWKDQSNERLSQALFDPQLQEDVPVDARLGQLSEMDDQRHLWGPWSESDTRIEVIDLSDDSVVYASNLCKVPVQCRQHMVGESIILPAVIGETREKGCFFVELALDHPFQLSNLQIIDEEYSDSSSLITHVMYENERFDVEGDTRTVESRASVISPTCYE